VHQRLGWIRRDRSFEFCLLKTSCACHFQLILPAIFNKFCLSFCWTGPPRSLFRVLPVNNVGNNYYYRPRINQLLIPLQPIIITIDPISTNYQLKRARWSAAIALSSVARQLYMKRELNSTFLAMKFITQHFLY
jgi:hypothetical protein